MKQSKFLLFALVIITTAIFSSCSPTIKTTASWVNKEKIKPPYKSVFIVVFSQNIEAKTILETDLQTAATARGLKAYKSIDEFGPVASLDKLPVKEAFIKKVKALGCETVFAVALIDEKSETKYVSSSTTIYSPYAYGRYGGIGIYGGFGGYYGYSSAVYNPGYYTTDKTYFLESNLYDAQSEEILMSIQSKATNPAAISKSSKLYTATLIDEINCLKLVKK